MKKLSLQTNAELIHYSINARNIDSVLIKDGYSGFQRGDELIKGACCGCLEKTCANYSTQELYTEKFVTFPKNTSPRVCPTDAIYFDEVGHAYIKKEECIRCGLCLHRCPYAAIQFSIKEGSCFINTEKDHNYSKCKHEEQLQDIAFINKKKKHILFTDIPSQYTNRFTSSLEQESNRFPDLSELLVRNTLLNIGYTCNANESGNNYNRTEFFAEINNSIIFGESQISNTDTLSVTRRILDDLSVLISRYSFNKDSLIPLAVVNGLPNRRTDYYEVIEDIHKVLGVQVITLTYHILFIINLFQCRITEEQLKQFVINREKKCLVPPLRQIIHNIELIDKNIDGIHYNPVK